MVTKFHENKLFSYSRINEKLDSIAIKLFGRAIVFRDVRIHKLTSKERSGKEKYLKIGNWVISMLRI